MKRKIAIAFVLTLAGAAACAGGLKYAPTAARTPGPPEKPPEVRVTQTAAGLTLPVVDSPYDDPRLAGLRAKERSRDFEGAMAIVAQARKVHASEPKAACAWAYIEGRSAVAANAHAAALAAFDAAAGASGCGLTSMARLRAAQSAAKLGQWDVALERVRDLDGDFVLASERVVTEAAPGVSTGQARRRQNLTGSGSSRGNVAAEPGTGSNARTRSTSWRTEAPKSSCVSLRPSFRA